MSIAEHSTVPPDVAEWYDLDATTAEVLAVLRLTDADVDADRIAHLVPSVAVQIDQYLDRCDAIAGPPPPEPIQYALVRGVDELYRAKDVPTAGLSAELRAILRPWKQRHGVA